MASQDLINDNMLNTEFSNIKNTKISWFSRELHGKKEIGLSWPTVELEPTLDRVGTVDEPQTGQSRLDVIILRGNARSRNNPLRIGRCQLHNLLQRLEMPQAVVRYIHSNNGELVHRPEYNDPTDPEKQTHMFVLLQSPDAETNCFTLALRTSLQTGNTVALLIVEAEKQLCGLGESLLAAEHQLRTCPVYLLTVLLDHYGRRNESHRHYLDMRLVDLEDKMSISPLIYTNHSTRPLPLDDSQTVSEESIIQELHDNNTRLIWLSGTINYEITALDFVTVLLDRLRGMGDRSRVGSPASHTVMVEELRALKTGAELRQFQRQNLQQRAETRIAMLYSRISQRDSKVSIEVAEQSRRIAHTAKEDSRTVKSVAMISFLFLPATFVATILSTGIFDFHDNGLVVSGYWWVYVCLVTAITAPILAGWAWVTPAKRALPVRYETAEKRLFVSG